MEPDTSNVCGAAQVADLLGWAHNSCINSETNQFLPYPLSTCLTVKWAMQNSKQAADDWFTTRAWRNCSVHSLMMFYNLSLKNTIPKPPSDNADISHQFEAVRLPLLADSLLPSFFSPDLNMEHTVMKSGAGGESLQESWKGGDLSVL